MTPLVRRLKERKLVQWGLGFISRRARRLSPEELRVLASAAAAVVLVRLSLWLLPSRVVLRRVSRLVADAPVAATPTLQVKRIGWAVRAVSRRIPRASCLTQALAAQVLLAREGYSAKLRIGVAHDPERGFVAHAWIDIDGLVLVGGRQRIRYSELPDISNHL